MRACNSLLGKGLLVVIGFWAFCAFSGCQAPAVAPVEPLEPVFFPASPDKPRLQFLVSFSSSKPFGKETKRSGLEDFLLGREEKPDQVIAKPYGLAMSDGKLYVCDTGKKLIAVLDFANNEFGYLTKDRRLTNPVGICVDDGIKYVTDARAGSIFVFGRDDKLIAIWGRQSGMRPLGVAVHGDRCYVTDVAGRQVVVLDKRTGEEIMRIGKPIEDPEQTEANENAQFRMISDVAVDQQGNVYVTDRLLGQISKFNAAGEYVRSFGHMGDSIHDFIRPKGIAFDRENRMWIVDAATQVCKIHNQQGQLLLYFGLPGNGRGQMNLPAMVTVDYENVEYFQDYAVEGAQLEFLIIITNQFGPHKISVYGFGRFPEQEKAAELKMGLRLEPQTEPESPSQ
jgi:sugar lactone lactonase YvrE